jgi:hypothetical protein
MDVERFTQMYVSPMSVIWSACAIFIAYKFAKWVLTNKTVKVDATQLPSPGMSFVYTEASTIVQARVILVLEMSADLQEATAELLLFHDGRKSNTTGTINLSEKRLTIGESGFDIAVISSLLMTELFLTLTHIVLAYWSMYNYYQLAPNGAGWPCQFIHIVLAPVFKPLAPSMWLALMSVGQFVDWHSSATTPEGTRRATATQLTPPPLPLNVVTYVCMYATALPLLVWAAAAIPFVVLLFLPPLWPLLIANMILLPALLIGGLPFCFKRVERLTDMVLNQIGASQVRGEGTLDVPDRAADAAEDDAQSHSLLLKVFATVM